MKKILLLTSILALGSVLLVGCNRGHSGHDHSKKGKDSSCCSDMKCCQTNASKDCCGDGKDKSCCGTNSMTNAHCDMHSDSKKGSCCKMETKKTNK